ncbi:MAG: hypothetical protein JWL59_1200 [Chthoniobacteraceae bacterium]|nr:hypothetical protein [Chthoniobacteraceae bacterium]
MDGTPESIGERQNEGCYAPKTPGFSMGHYGGIDALDRKARRRWPEAVGYPVAHERLAICTGEIIGEKLILLGKDAPLKLTAFAVW